MFAYFIHLYQSLGFHDTLADFTAVVTILAGAFLVGYITYRVCIRFLILQLEKYMQGQKNHPLSIVAKERVLDRLILFVPAAFVMGVLPSLKTASTNSFGQELLPLTEKIATIYLLILGGVILDKIVTTVEKIYNLYPISKEWPIKSYVQFLKVFLFIIFAILVLATVMNKSPLAFITGLGAVMAIIILVFKDAILSFVASLQISSSKMFKKGDWIEIADKGISGYVIDMSLNTVKVQNFDKTISMVPPYYLTMNAVKNWQGMFESGGRRIRRAIIIDEETIQFANEALITQLKTLPLMEAVFDKNQGTPPTQMVNVELFRQYIEAFISTDPRFHHQGFLGMARQLQPGNYGGLPIEVYVFTVTTSWVEHEHVQADLFAHLFALLPLFGLKPYQQA